MFTTIVFHSKHCFDSNDYADDMTVTCGDGREKLDRRMESHMENQIHDVDCTNYHQMGLQSSVLPSNGLHDKAEASTTRKLIIN